MTDLPLGPAMITVAGTGLDGAERARLLHPLVGGVILFRRNFESTSQLRALIGAIRALRNPALIVAVDQEGGQVQRFRDGFVRLPPAARLGEVFDADPDRGRRLVADHAWLMASELAACGIDHSFAPCVDIDHHRSAAIDDRALNADPARVADLAACWMAGAARAGMVSTLKHFPGHGYAEADSHVDQAEDARCTAELERDMAPYRTLLQRPEAAAVMTAHVVYPAVDPLPPTFSRHWLKTVLRGELEFGGLILSDDLTMAGATAFGSVGDCAHRCLDAGCDVLLCCNDADAHDELLASLSTPEAAVAGFNRLEILRLRPDGELCTGAQKERIAAELGELCA